MSATYAYSYDDNGNVESIAATSQSGEIQKMLPGLLENSPSASSFTRDGSDQLDSASLASGESLSFAYDSSHGQLTAISDAQESGFSLSFESDALLHLPLSQTVRDEPSGNTLLSARITYDAQGMRATRTVSAGSEGKGSSSSTYWYGGGLFPLVITRDGADYRLLGKSVVEEADSDRPAKTYLRADHLGSVRMATDDQGQVVQSLSYDDYGLTRIAGESSAAAEDSVATFYRFQGQEQEIFPLAKLGIDNSALAQWLDQIGLYHFPWRDYAAGLASFTQIDPIPTEDSLYAALGANPVNFTDETGGMLEEGLPQRRYASLKRVEIGALTNIDPEAQMLLDRIVADPNATFSSAQVDKMRLAHYSVLYEYPDQIAAEFELRSRELTDAFEGIAKAEYMSAAKKIMAERNIASADLLGQDEQTSIVEEALKLSQSHKSERYKKAEAKLDRFESMASSYASRRQEWLEKYTPAIEGYLRSGHQDDEKDDEKANEPLIVIPAERNVELVPFAHGERNVDPDSDGDLSDESANPNPQEGNMPIPIHPPRGDENPGRCCNIL